MVRIKRPAAVVMSAKDIKRLVDIFGVLVAVDRRLAAQQPSTKKKSAKGWRDREKHKGLLKRKPLCFFIHTANFMVKNIGY